MYQETVLTEQGSHSRALIKKDSRDRIQRMNIETGGWRWLQESQSLTGDFLGNRKSCGYNSSKGLKNKNVGGYIAEWGW